MDRRASFEVSLDFFPRIIIEVGSRPTSDVCRQGLYSRAFQAFMNTLLARKTYFQSLGQIYSENRLNRVT